MKFASLWYCLNQAYQDSHQQSKLISHRILQVSSQCQTSLKTFSKIDKSMSQKRMLKTFLTFHIIFKVFFKNYSLSIINAHRSFVKMLQGRKYQLCESSMFSHLLERRGALGLVGTSMSMVLGYTFQLIILGGTCQLYIAEDSYKISNDWLFKRSDQRNCRDSNASIAYHMNTKKI